MEDFTPLSDKYESDFAKIKHIIFMIRNVIVEKLDSSKIALKITSIAIRLTTSLTILLPKILVDVNLYKDMSVIEKKTFLIDGIMSTLNEIFNVLNETIKIMKE